MTAQQADFVRLTGQEIKEVRKQIRQGEEQIKELNHIRANYKGADTDKFLEESVNKIFNLTEQRKQMLKDNTK